MHSIKICIGAELETLKTHHIFTALNLHNSFVLNVPSSSTHQAIWQPWLTKQRRRPALDLVVVVAVSTILEGGGHGGARLRRKRRRREQQWRRRRKRRGTSKGTSPRKPRCKRTHHKVMESRRQAEKLVGATADVAQSRSKQLL